MTPQLPALILAAGRGERMRPLTDRTPKPLLPVRGKPLIEWHLEALARDGVRDVVINTAWLEEQFPATLGDGSRWGLRIRYSMEGRDHGGALETAGGIAKAMPWLIEGGAEAFWVVSGDIHVPDFLFEAAQAERFLRSRQEAHLWLVPNPPFHPQGDFGFDAGTGLALAEAGPDGRRWTYSNLALVRPSLTRHITPGTHAKLGPLLYQGMSKGSISATIYGGHWENVGTPEQLANLNA
ncbi:N-acetylmuramate alpha-1-phosphate uridylyltransferase MurU [Methylibium rhizosphaerae]|uniref:N-acetylmuramate alpha-1-phosphate uridylyltransferase MurU n=1 Tax=Methylibium rhizosphaerae TaxID=2570323 RepID=UPI00112BAF4B|nr:nucleotidyltransferase family protein [Methylibium rhizosphaerae]